MKSLVEGAGSVGLFSTGAQLEIFMGVLYNVDGSSDDPTVDGLSWRALLAARGIDGACNVANETPAGNSHPAFNVGGHMTPNADGQVAVGEDSFLMPLCSWHNHKARDGVAFSLIDRRVLRLSGFMQGDIAASFAARMPSAERFALIHGSSSGWGYANLSDRQADAARQGDLPDQVPATGDDPHVLLERVTRDGRDVYVVCHDHKLR
ncbi:hypothetical protein ACS3SW_02785 [Roseobacteraceae bacterium S113]